jgi:hypothetical protein
MSRSYLQPPGDFGDGNGNKRKQSRPDGRCVHNWTSPVTFRSEQPTPVTHFAITCETSTASSKKKVSPNLLSLSFSRRFLLQSAVLRPLTVPLPMALISRYVDPIAGSSLAGGTAPAQIPISTSSTRLGSSLTISGARKRRRWL